jgi:hypothetical protein
MTGRELLDGDGAGAVEMPAKVRAEPSQIEFFPCSDGNRAIARGNHKVSELFVLPKL